MAKKKLGTNICSKIVETTGDFNLQGKIKSVTKHLSAAGGKPFLITKLLAKMKKKLLKIKRIKIL